MRAKREEFFDYTYTDADIRLAKVCGAIGIIALAVSLLARVTI